jgi:hypothetical protein
MSRGAVRTALAETAGRPLSTRASLALTAAAVVLLVVTFAAPSRHWSERSDYSRIGDIPVYYEHGRPVLDGGVPYRDYRLEYPPGALPVFIVPAIRFVARGPTAHAIWRPTTNHPARRYAEAFARLMILLTAAMIGLTWLSLAALDRGGAETVLALAFLGSIVLVLGFLLYTRFDVWPATLTAAALAALLRNRFILAGAALGVAVAAKVYPLVLAPVAVIYVWRRRGKHDALRLLAAAAVVVVAIFVPFLALAPRGLRSSLDEQFKRGLQIESVGSAGLVAVNHVFHRKVGLDYSVHANRTGLEAQELRGPLTEEVRVSLGVLTLVAVLGLAIGFVRGPPSPDRLVRYAAATVTAVVALGPVLSPQFLIWLLPLVPLVGGRRMFLATGLLAAAVATTHIWFPGHYRTFAQTLSGGSTALLLSRDLLLLALLVVLVWPAAHRRPVELDRPVPTPGLAG